MKIATSTERLSELFDSDPRNDTAIASALGVSKQTVSSWRNGRRSPKKAVLINIAKMFNVSLEWLMGFDVEKDAKKVRIQMITNSELFLKLITNMSPEDYDTVMRILEKTELDMKEKGIW